MKSKALLIATSLIMSMATLVAEPLVYKVDTVHSGVGFKIRHFINKVPGTFTAFQGEIHFDKENPSNSKAFGKVEVASIDTRNEDRDAHLKSDDFFNAGENPLIEFTSTKWTEVGENAYRVEGLLTMAGKENPVVIDLAYLGEMEDRGKIRSGWEGTTTIDRTEWGISYGTPAVGKEVEIELNVQAHRDAPGEG